MTNDTNTVATLEDEMRTAHARVQAIVATAEAEQRELTAEEDAETRNLFQKMRSLDARRRARRTGETFDDLLGGLTRGQRPPLAARAFAGPPGDSLGAQLVRSEQFTQFLAHLGHGRPISMQPIEIRAAGTPLLPPAGGHPALTVAPPPTGPLAPWGQASVAGLFPSLPAQGGSISYLRDVRTGLETPLSSAGTAPGAAKPETALAPTLIEAALATIATWSKVANTVLEDVPGFQAWMDSILAAGVFDAEAAHIVAAILATAGIVTVTPATGASVADTLLTAAMTVQTRAHLPATGAIVAPDVFTALATAKASTSGVYLSGLPLSAAPSMTLWGQLQLVVSPALAAGTALVVASRAGALYRRGSLRIDISDSNEDDFIRNLLAIRIEERVAFATYKPTGFASVTGLVTP